MEFQLGGGGGGAGESEGAGPQVLLALKAWGPGARGSSWRGLGAGGAWGPWALVVAEISGTRGPVGLSQVGNQFSLLPLLRLGPLGGGRRTVCRERLVARGAARERARLWRLALFRSICHAVEQRLEFLRIERSLGLLCPLCPSFRL